MGGSIDTSKLGLGGKNWVKMEFSLKFLKLFLHIPPLPATFRGRLWDPIPRIASESTLQKSKSIHQCGFERNHMDRFGPPELAQNYILVGCEVRRIRSTSTDFASQLGQVRPTSSFGKVRPNLTDFASPLPPSQQYVKSNQGGLHVPGARFLWDQNWG
jgi:hypothetical protein